MHWPFISARCLLSPYRCGLNQQTTDYSRNASLQPGIETHAIVGLYLLPLMHSLQAQDVATGGSPSRSKWYLRALHPCGMSDATMHNLSLVVLATRIWAAVTVIAHCYFFSVLLLVRRRCAFTHFNIWTRAAVARRPFRKHAMRLLALFCFHEKEMSNCSLCVVLYIDVWCIKMKDGVYICWWLRGLAWMSQ